MPIAVDRELGTLRKAELSPEIGRDDDAPLRTDPCSLSRSISLERDVSPQYPIGGLAGELPQPLVEVREIAVVEVRRPVPRATHTEEPLGRPPDPGRRPISIPCR